MNRLSPTKHSASEKRRLDSLWSAYWSRGEEAIDALVEAYIPLTHRVLERISIRLPSHIPVEDLSQAALMGLYKAVVAFNPERGVPFEAYAYPRIRGAILDELRANDFLSRSKRAQVEKVEMVIGNWMREHDEMPTEEDIAAELDISVSEFNLLIEEAKPLCSLDAASTENRSMQETIADPNCESENEVRRSDIQDMLRKGFKKLAAREQKVLYLYYFEELRLSEIAQMFELSEARVSQIHALSIIRLRAGLSEAYPSEFAA